MTLEKRIKELAEKVERKERTAGQSGEAKALTDFLIDVPEVREAVLKKVADKSAEIRRQESMVDTLAEVGRSLSELRREAVDREGKAVGVIVRNHLPQIEEIRVKNLEEIVIPEFPKEISVNNFPEQKEIKVKKPEWFSLDWLKKELIAMRKGLGEMVRVDLSAYTKAKNPLAIRLVNRDGKFYEAIGSGGASSAYTGKIYNKANEQINPATDDTLQSLVGLAIPEHDKIELGYTGSNLTSVVYKNGATTVATLTLAYTGSQLDTVTKS